MRFVDSPEDEVDFAPRPVDTHVLHEQFRDDLVGAGEIQQLHVREVDDRQRPLTDPVELLLYLASHRRAGRARDEIGIQLAHALAQHRADVDVVAHPMYSGIIICTCAPGKYGRPWTIRSESSESQLPFGGIMIRAVPLRN